MVLPCSCWQKDCLESELGAGAGGTDRWGLCRAVMALAGLAGWWIPQPRDTTCLLVHLVMWLGFPCCLQIKNILQAIRGSDTNPHSSLDAMAELPAEASRWALAEPLYPPTPQCKKIYHINFRSDVSRGCRILPRPHHASHRCVYPKLTVFLLPEIYLLMFALCPNHGSHIFFTNRSNPWNCCVHFGSVLWPPILSMRIFLSLSKRKSCLDGPARDLFIPASHLWQWPMQGKCKKCQHGQLMDKPDQFRTLLSSTHKSSAKLNPMVESFKSPRKKKANPTFIFG